MLAASNSSYTGPVDPDPTIASLQRAWLTLSRQAQLPGTDERLRREAGIDLARPALTALARLTDQGPLTISELAATSGVDISTMSRTLKHLTDRGFARRQRGGDLRCIVIEITPDGRMAVEQMIAAGQRVLRDLLGDWNEADLSQLAHLLTRFSEDFVRYANRDPNRQAATIGER